MIALLAFGVLLLSAVLLSELAEQSVFSLSVLFLVGGVAVGMSGLLALSPQVVVARWLKGQLAPLKPALPPGQANANE